MRQLAPSFEELGLEVAVVTFFSREKAARYRDALALPFACLADPDRSVYRLYGLGRASLLQTVHPQVIRRYVGLWLKGGKLVRPEEDPVQLGGDFLMDENRRLAIAFSSRNPADRPSPALILRAALSLRT